MWWRVILLTWALSSLSGTAVFAQEDDPVLGRLGDYSLKRSDLDRMMSYHSSEEQKALQEKPEQQVIFLKKLLEMKAVSDIAKKEKFDERPEVKAQLLYIINDFLSREYLKEVVMKDVTVAEENLKEFYEINEENLILPEQVRMRHLLIRVSPDFSVEEKSRAKEKAQGLLKRLMQGEDFARIAEVYSEDSNPDARKNGGDLGCFTKGQMMQPIEVEAFSLKSGQISNIVETQDGYHILKVEDHREARPRSFDEVKELIRERLQEESANLKVEEFIKDAAEKGGLEIYDGKITGEKEAE